MQKRFFTRFLLGFSMLLSLTPIQARADFLIQFTDHGQVIVRRYVEEGQTIKIYTPQGTIGFRKDDVAQISEVDTSLSLSTPLETVSTLFPLQQASSSTSRGEQWISGEEKIKEEAPRTNDSLTVKIEHLDGEYQEVEREINALLEKHSQDMDLEASEEVLAENRLRLEALNHERHKLIDVIRQIIPDNLPTWAQ